MGKQKRNIKEWGKLYEARKLHKEQEKICEELGYKEGLSKSYCGQGIILNAQGSLVEAMELYKKEEAICKEFGDKVGLQRSNWNMGHLFKEMKKHDEAIKRFKESIKLEEELKDPRLEKDKKFLAEYEETVRKKI